MKDSRKQLKLVHLLFLYITLGASTLMGQGKTIIDEWAMIPLPPAPELKPVILDPKTTAFLILDMQKNSCTPQNRPRCAASVPVVKAFLDLCRQRGIFVAHSLTSTATPEDIVPELAPINIEPIVRSSIDKFYKTDLEKILSEKGIKSVVIAGTAAHGAVLHTATGASIRGLNVIIPVDGMSADIPFAEQYTAWHILNSPGTRRNSTLTKFSFIQFK